ncbi:hypothetical protein [Nocardioides dongkuii]|uniref:hypothetical protein n=1 Tax=Nocardioides dongkuii TaxID=2760089 RepID=UPI0015F7B1C1|nr:hypothetical protein [Nocardioides dongkuii]
MTARVLHLHIGLQKTGTSYLQRIFWDSVPELSRQGVDLVPGTKLGTFRLMLDVRGRFNPAIDPPSVGTSVERLPDQLRGAAGDALLSQESLATATSEQIERLLAATADREVRVIVTLRDLGRQIPSAWQQTLQTGKSEPLGRYVRRLRSTQGTDAKMWATMDAPAILERWRKHVPADQITVVTVPPGGSAPRLLLDRFCSVLGVSADELVVDPGARGNRSLRAEQAEVLRRVNRQLPPEFKRRNVYGDLGKRYFAVKVLGDDSGTKIQLPDDLYDWTSEVSQQHVAHIRDGGYRVVGDLDDLLPVRSDFSTEPVRVSHKAVAEVSTRVITQLLVDRMEDRNREAQRPVPAAPAPAAARPTGRLAGVVDRFRR